MTRNTSIEVYHQIESEGLLSKLRFLVYDIIFKKGPLTIAEASSFASKIDSRSISPRFAELQKRGVITTIGRKFCSVTGREVILWDVTNNLPIKLEKPTKILCQHCNGRGHFIEQQGRLF
jgi:hypothetical protein